MTIKREGQRTAWLCLFWDYFHPLFNRRYRSILRWRKMFKFWKYLIFFSVLNDSQTYNYLKLLESHQFWAFIFLNNSVEYDILFRDSTICIVNFDIFYACTCIYIGILEASNEAVQIKCSLLHVLITASFSHSWEIFFRKVLIVYHLIQLRGLDGRSHF